MRLRVSVLSAALVLAAAARPAPAADPSRDRPHRAAEDRPRAQPPRLRPAAGRRRARASGSASTPGSSSSSTPSTIDDAAVEAKIKTQFPTLRLARAQAAAGRTTKRSAASSTCSRRAATRRTSSSAPASTSRSASGAEYKAPEKPGLGAVVKMLGGNVTLRALTELQVAKLIRAAESERQLNEVMVDFWSNHFNVDVKKDACRIYRIVDDREVIRPHVLGKFRHLLGAVAASPGMLTYLDNWQNSAPHDGRRRRAARPLRRHREHDRDRDRRAEAGEASRRPRAASTRTTPASCSSCTRSASTAGTRRRTSRRSPAASPAGRSTRSSARSRFEARKHDDGPKTVLGHAIPAGGGDQGRDDRARHPRQAPVHRTLHRDEAVPAAHLGRPAGGGGRARGAGVHGNRRRPARGRPRDRDQPRVLRAGRRAGEDQVAAGVRRVGGAGGGRRASSRAAAALATLQVRYVLEGAGTTGFGAERVSAMRRQDAQLARLRHGPAPLRLPAAHRLPGGLAQVGQPRRAVARHELRRSTSRPATA